MAHRSATFALVSLLALGVAACGSGSKSSVVGGDEGAATATAEPTTEAAEVTFPLTIDDAAGKEHTFAKPVERIGCGTAGCMQDLADLGVAPTAGWTDKARKAFTHGAAGPPATTVDDTWSPEDWAGADVELIVMPGPRTKDSEAMSQAAPVFYPAWSSEGVDAGQPPALEGYRSNVQTMANLIGKPELAAAALERWDTLIANIAAKRPPDLAGKTVALLDGYSEGYYLSADSIGFCQAIAEHELGTCVPQKKTGEINAEKLLALDPDWIVYMTGEDEKLDFARTRKDDAVWKALRAVKEGQVYNAGDGYYCCSLRALEFAVQEYAANVFGPDAGIPEPGSARTFDPGTNPLAQGTS